MGRWTMVGVLAALALAAGCADETDQQAGRAPADPGKGDLIDRAAGAAKSIDADAPTALRRTAAPTPPRSKPKPPPPPTSDVPLLTDMSSGLDLIVSISTEGGACGADILCLTDSFERLGAVADAQLVGLERRVANARHECVKDAGEWYILALKRYALGRDFVRSGDIPGATNQIVLGSGHLTSAGEAAQGCRAG